MILVVLIVVILAVGIYGQVIGTDKRSIPRETSTPTKQESIEDSYWVTEETINRHTCPASSCGIVGQLMFRENVKLLEAKDGWVRTSRYYSASCIEGRSKFVESGDAMCSPKNGIVDGQFAEWVPLRSLSKHRPPDPGAGATGIAALISQSDDFRTYEKAFVQATQKLIQQGDCTAADFREVGGWMKSTANKNQPIYFTYCGGWSAQNKIYLNAAIGEITE